MAHSDELDAARMGAAADLVYLLDASRQHLEASEELALANLHLESPDLAEKVMAAGLAVEESEGGDDLLAAQVAFEKIKLEVLTAKNRVKALASQVGALRQLHRKCLDEFMGKRPGPAEATALDRLEELEGPDALERLYRTTTDEP